jgi:protein TonB
LRLARREGIAKRMHVLELAHDRDHVASARAGGSSAMNGIEDSRRGGPRMRISLPLCFLASFGLHAALLAMSSTWMSGAKSVRSRESRAASDEELETYTIYLRVPEAGGGASAHGNERSANESSAEAAIGGTPQSKEAARAGSADAPTVLADTAPIASEANCTELAQSLALAESLGIVPSPSMNAATQPAPSATTLAAATIGSNSESATSEREVERATSGSKLESAPSASDSNVTTSSTDTKSAASSSDSTSAAASSDSKDELRSNDPTSAARAEDSKPSATSSAAKAATATNALPSPSEPAKPSSALDAPSGSRADSKGVAGAASASAQGAASESAGSALGKGGGGAHTTANSGAEHGEGNGAGGARAGAEGGGANAPGAVLTFGPRPAYPSEAVRRGEEGKVLCALHIDVRGTVTRVDVLRSSGHELLDHAAIDALMRWRFLPARNDGRAVACRVPHWITFRLE